MAAEDEAHFLHAHHGLTLLVRPVERGARHLAIGPGDAVYAVDEDGVMHRVHPAMGTEVVGEIAGPLGLAADRARVVAVASGGVMRWWDRAGDLVGQADHPFVGPVQARVVGNRTYVVGDGPDDRQLLVYEGQERSLRVYLPPGAQAGGEGDDLTLFWASDQGLETLRVEGGGRFAGRRAARCALRVAAGEAIGIEPDALVLFHADPPVRVAEAGVTAVAATPDGGAWIAGNGDGELVVLFRGREAHPARLSAHEGAVNAIAVDRKGGMVASAAEGLVLWGLDR